MELTCLKCGHTFDLTGFVGGTAPACPKCPENPWPEKEDTQPNLDPSWPQAPGAPCTALSQSSNFEMLPQVQGLPPLLVAMSELLVLQEEEEKMREKTRQEWRRKLTPKSPVHGPNGFPQIEIGGWDLHELYTILVDDEGPEGCCAGCTMLPPGWCSLCDKQRKPEGVL
jgi:hypothetical protein